MIRTLLFDLDGTLIDTWRLYMEAYRCTFEQWYGRRFEQAETLALLALRPRSETWLLEKVLGADSGGRAPADAFTLFLDYYRRLHATHFDGVYDGVPATLRTLQQQGYRLGIVTGKSRPAWTITEAHAQLGPFDVVITETDVAQPKPDPQGIQAALAALDTSATAAATSVYIGDSLLDVEAAVAAGLPCWAALWAKSTDEREAFIAGAQARGATRILHAPADLLTALGTATQ